MGGMAIRVPTIEIILAESKEPDMGQLQACWPDAKVTWIDTTRCAHRFWSRHPREGWRMNDYYKAYGLLHSDADVAIAFDADMHILEPEIVGKWLPYLALRFGLCLPANPRLRVGKDAAIGADGRDMAPSTCPYSYAVNCSPIAYSSTPISANVVEMFLRIMRENPTRGPLAWVEAITTVIGSQMHLLPPQWCVCAEDVGIAAPLILHAGHDKVREYYKLGEFANG